MALDVMVDESPGLTDDGLAEQLMVGGWNALMVNCAVQSADWPGFGPSVTWPVTVYVPGAADTVVGSGGRLIFTKISKKLRAGKFGPGGPLATFSCTMPMLLGVTPANVPALTIGQERGTAGMRGSGGQRCPSVPGDTLERIKLLISVSTSSVGGAAAAHRKGMAG